MNEENPTVNVLFRVVVIVAVVSIIALVVALAYYLYSAYQVQSNKTQQSTSSNVTPTPFPPPGQATPTISPSDKTTTLENELNSANLEDVQGDFTKLQLDSAGL